MTTITTRLKVNADGNVVVPIGVTEAGQEVLVSVSPTLPKSEVTVSKERWQQVLRETFGAIKDPAFTEPEYGPDEPIAPLDLK